MNLVRNYSFEDVVAGFNCANSPTPEPGPGNPGQSDLENYWNQISYWTCPDRKILCAGAGSADCNCDFGVARSGTHYGSGTNREYICQELSQSINSGETFYYEFFIKSSGGGLFENAGIKLFDERPKQCGYAKLDPNSSNNPQLKIINVTKDGEWHKVSGFLVADHTFNWIALGTFVDDKNYTQTIVWDDIKIIKASSCPTNWLFENTTFENEQRIYQASDKIIAGEDVDAGSINGPVVVKTNSNIIFKAGNQIILEPGFSTEVGAYFETVIEPCSPNICPYIPPGLNDVTICDANPIQIGNAGAETGLTYSWSPSTYLDNPNSPNPTFTPPSGSSSIEYTVTITSICGYFISYNGPFPTQVPSITENVMVNYHTIPDPNPIISITNTLTSDYSFSTDFTVGAETEEYCVQITEQGTGTIVYSNCFDVVPGSCCNYNFNYDMLFPFEKNQFSICKDYTIQIAAKNFCSSNLAYDQFDWNRNGTLDLISISNVMSIPDVPNNHFTAQISGADDYHIVIFTPQGNIVHETSGTVNSEILDLWDGWCDGPTCINFGPNHPCWVDNGTFYYVLELTSACEPMLSQASFITLFYDYTPLSCNRSMIISSDSVSLSNKTMEAELLIYPNPTNSYLEIEYPDGISSTSISVFDNTGRMVFETKEYTKKIDLSSFSNGIYFLEIMTEQGMFREKIIKQ